MTDCPFSFVYLAAAPKNLHRNLYPIVLIPEKIENGIKKEITKKEVFNYLNVKFPRPETSPLPVEPMPYVYIDNETF